MPYALKGRNVLVTAGSRGLGALICEKFAAEGCNVAINYIASKDRAEQLSKKIAKEYKVKTILIQGDMGLQEDCKSVIKQSIDGLQGLDIIISNAGWTKPSSWKELDALTEEDWDKHWAVNVKGNVWLLREASPTFNANPEGGVFLMTSSVAGIATSGSSLAYSVTKAAGLQLMQAMAQHQGPKIRVNAILPGLLLTEWWGGGRPDHADQAMEHSALKQETKLDDCADAYVAAAKNSSMTGAKIQIDSGVMIRP